MVKAKLLRRMPIHPMRVAQGFPPFYEAGREIDHPRAFKLVIQGVAVPADKECENRVRHLLPRMDELVFAGERRERSIHMDDFDAYGRGLMIGYKPDGKTHDTWLPGPNWKEGCEKAYYQSRNQEDDDDD